ncbi:MAG TPA: O-acetyl-ADP-ribose deacetylase [Tepidisphaeraceae bacterium]|jgi:O-acetyl-ADP-ribose deacetylase (regulator of RNase III)
MSNLIQVIESDITTLHVDAVVNAANESLLGGGGVDGAIHRAAGPKLLEECRQLPQVRPNVRCPTGEARITKAYHLPAKHVIHTAGPIWNDGSQHEETLLANCYRNALQLALDNNLKSIAFPAISTGVYAFPLNQAAPIAVATINDFLHHHPHHFTQILLVCFGPQALQAYHAALKR